MEDGLQRKLSKDEESVVMKVIQNAWKPNSYNYDTLCSKCGIEHLVHSTDSGSHIVSVIPSPHTARMMIIAVIHNLDKQYVEHSCKHMCTLLKGDREQI